MLTAHGIEPVSMDDIAVGIESAKERVFDRRFPDVSLRPHPVLRLLRAGNHNLFAGRGLIDDALRVRGASPRRTHSLAVDPSVHPDHVARLRQIGRMLNRAERSRFGT